MESMESVMLPALDTVQGSGVVWRSVARLVNFINESKRIDKDLHYSLKARMKSNDVYKILNTLTVFHAIVLNSLPIIRQQLSDKSFLRSFGKVFTRNKDPIIQNAIMQLLMDWSFLFSREELGQRSKRLLHELSIRNGKTVRPTSLVAEIYEEMQSNNPSNAFIKGFEFEYRADQIVIEIEDTADFSNLKSCTPTLTHGNFKFGSMKRIFNRNSSRSLTSSKRSSIVQELSIRGDSTYTYTHADDLVISIPRDVKKLQDLLSDLQVLLKKGYGKDIESKMEVAEQLKSCIINWRQKLQDTITKKIKMDNPGSSEDLGRDISPGMFATLLHIRESLHSVLAEYDQTHDIYLIELAKVEKDKGEDLFVTARSSSSTTSLTYGSTGEFQWVDFSAEKDPKTGLPSSPYHSPTMSRSSGLGNGHTTNSAKTRSELSKLSASEHPVNVLNSPVLRSEIPKVSTSQIPPRPLSAIPKPPQHYPNFKIESLAQLKQFRSLKQSHDLSQSTRHSDDYDDDDDNDADLDASIRDTHSRSFSSLNPLQSQFSGPKRLSNCPALKVRFTDDHLAEVMDQMSKLR